MRNYLNLFSTKARLLYLGSALLIAPVTSTFAILPMMSQEFEPSSVTVASEDEEQWNSYTDLSGEDSYLDVANNTAKQYESELLVFNIQQLPIVSLRERTIIMSSTL
ncbi:hypothetical protein ACS8E3_03645 [Psychrobacter sp. 2Y5]|uniref:hypothetical protein n=1 Tax=unclassified Psychrobacter TaxID=196806 RepID=UPI003F477E65